MYTALLPSASGESDNDGSTGCCGDGITGVSLIGAIGDCVRTRLEVLGEVIKVDGGGTGAIGIVGVAAAVAAATAANSSSAFLIKSKSLKVLNVLLVSRDETSDVAFSDWLIREDEDGEYLSVF